MMNTCCLRHVEAWNKYIEKECLKLVINQNYVEMHGPQNVKWARQLAKLCSWQLHTLRLWFPSCQVCQRDQKYRFLPYKLHLKHCNFIWVDGKNVYKALLSVRNLFCSFPWHLFSLLLMSSSTGWTNVWGSSTDIFDLKFNLACLFLKVTLKLTVLIKTKSLVTSASIWICKT
jgi:hypothetical protein